MPDQQIMLITGTRTGIGRQIAEYYLQKKFLVIGCSRGASDLQYQNYRHYQLDIGNETDVCNMFYEIRRNYGTLHYLINNAGIASMNHSFLTPGKTVTNILNTNIAGTFFMCREAGKIMSVSNFGRIINFTTNIIKIKISGESIYVASKHAIIGLTEALATELSDFGITVNAIGPTAMKTDILKNVPNDKIENLINKQPIKKMATYEDITHITDFFISPSSRLISGQAIYLGGV